MMEIQGFVVGVLTAKVNPEDIKSLFDFFGDRLGSRSTEIEIDVEGKQIKLKATSQEDLKVAMKATKEFIKKQDFVVEDQDFIKGIGGVVGGVVGDGDIVGEIPPWE